MLAGTAVYGTVRTVVWEDGGGDPASYPIVGGEATVGCLEDFHGHPKKMDAHFRVSEL